jgi:FG-GAP-like repeat
VREGQLRHALWFTEGVGNNIGRVVAQNTLQPTSTHDFNGDCKSDMLWRNTTTGDLGIWLMNGTQTLSPPVDLGNVPNTWLVVGTGDFNGDGMSDILWRKDIRHISRSDFQMIAGG